MDIERVLHDATSDQNQRMDRAAELLARKASGQEWEEWVEIGAGFMEVRNLAMRALHLNEPRGRAYNAYFAALCKAKKLAPDLDSITRSNLLFCLEPENREICNRLRNGMPLNEKLKVNHPTTMAKRVRKMQKIYRDHEGAGADITDEKERKPPIAHRLREAEREIARLKSIDGSLFDLKKDTPESIARICGETVGLSHAKRIRKALDEWIARADKTMKAKASKPAG